MSGMMETAKDKMSDAYEATKDAACNMKDKVLGTSCEDKAADNVKSAADSCCGAAKDARDKVGNKMHEAGQRFKS